MKPSLTTDTPPPIFPNLFPTRDLLPWCSALASSRSLGWYTFTWQRERLTSLFPLGSDTWYFWWWLSQSRDIEESLERWLSVGWRMALNWHCHFAMSLAASSVLSLFITALSAEIINILDTVQTVAMPNCGSAWSLALYAHGYRIGALWWTSGCLYTLFLVLIMQCRKACIYYEALTGLHTEWKYISCGNSTYSYVANLHLCAAA